MPQTDTLRDELADVGQRRAAAREALRATSEQIPALARRAHKAGVPKSEIARLANVSRPALDAMLDGRTPR